MTDFALTYADALYSLAADENKEAEYYGELRQISEILKDNPELVKLLDSPAVAPGERLSVADEVFSGVQPYILNCIKLLTEKRCVFSLEKCIMHFSDKYEDARNIERVTAVTAVRLDDALTEKLREKLAGMTGKEVILENEVNPEIIGGILLRFKNREIDGSVKTRIAEIERAIKL